jgi:hypothetical protein
LVVNVLADPNRKELWRKECAAMAHRLAHVRRQLHDALVAENVKGTWSHLKLQSGMFGVTYADVAITMTTTLNYIMVTIPSGKTNRDIVSIVPITGFNDNVFLEGVILGTWSGVQLSTQVNLLVRLGNAVASTTGFVRIYFRST